MRSLLYEDAGISGTSVNYTGGSGGGTVGTPILTAPTFLDLRWGQNKPPLKALHKGYKLALFLGSDADNTDQYLFPPVYLGPDERRYVYTVSTSQVLTINAAIKTLFFDNSESEWKYLASSVMINPVTINLGAGAYNLSFASPGLPGAGVTLLSFAATVPFTVHATGHTLTCSVNPTAVADIKCYKNGVLFGTLELSTLGVLSLVAFSSTAFAIGDLLTVVAPSPQDATLSGPSFVLMGNV